MGPINVLTGLPRPLAPGEAPPPVPAAAPAKEPGYFERVFAIYRSPLYQKFLRIVLILCGILLLFAAFCFFMAVITGKQARVQIEDSHPKGVGAAYTAATAAMKEEVKGYEAKSSSAGLTAEDQALLEAPKLDMKSGEVTLQLTNGGSITGRIAQESESGIVLAIDGGTVTFSRGELARIIRPEEKKS